MTLNYINKTFLNSDNLDNQNTLSFEIWDLYFKKNTFPSIQIRNKLNTNCLDNNSIEENSQDSIDSKNNLNNDKQLANITSISKKGKLLKNKLLDINEKKNNFSINKNNISIKDNCLIVKNQKLFIK